MISKSPRIEGQFQNPIRFARAARVCFQTILENLDFGPSDRILLPAYIGITDREGSGVMDPVLAANIKPEFYPVNHRLTGDLNFIREQLKSGTVKALLVIHYFGIVQNNMHVLRDLCDEYATILIEDCAHAWCSAWNGTTLGEFGEYSFGSIHKYLAANDGGFAKWNTELELRGGITPENEISTSSLIEYVSADYPSIADIRIRNYQHLITRLGNRDDIEIMFCNLDNGIIPLNFPILVKGMPRERLYYELVDRGYTLIALYYRLISDINSSTFPISHDISKRILNLPVHQEINLTDLDKLVEAMLNILEKGPQHDG